MLVWLVIAAAAAYAQDPYKVAPNVYHLELENDWVRVSRVTYKPGDKVPLHDHPALPTVYVYTTDGGPILFGHREFVHMQRRPVRAGQIRFNRGNRETHFTEYLGDAASEYLRVELKTQPDVLAGDVRRAPEDHTPFENKQVRIERLSCPCERATTPLVAITRDDGKAHWVQDGPPPPGPQIQIRLLSSPQGAKSQK